MVVLADEILESFFQTDLSASFQLEPVVVEAPLAQSNSSFLGGLLSSIVTDDNKKIFNRVTDEIGKTIGRHQASSPNPKLMTTFFSNPKETGRSQTVNRKANAITRTKSPRILTYSLNARICLSFKSQDKRDSDNSNHNHNFNSHSPSLLT